MVQAQIIKEIAQDVREDIKEGIHMYQAKKTQQRAFDYGEKMYKNRYQWATNDLRKAGLNPVLAASSGVGGSGGAGPTATSSQASSAKRVNLLEMEKQKAETELTKEMAETQRTQQGVNSALKKKTLADKDVSVKELDKLQEMINNLEQQTNESSARQKSILLDQTKKGAVSDAVGKGSKLIKSISKPSNIFRKAGAKAYNIINDIINKEREYRKKGKAIQKRKYDKKWRKPRHK